MKQAILLITILFIIAFASCKVAVTTRYTPYRTPEYRSRNHWGAPRRTSVHRTYWGRHRYGPRPHRERGRYHD